MAPVNDAVFLRRNNQVQDAIDGQNLKQALQLIEKRMKKGEDGRFLKAWKAHVLFRHADEAHHKRGIAETLELCNAEPPTTDLETLDILFKTLQKMDGRGDIRASLWDKAAKAKPQDLEIQLQWFNIAFTDNDFKSAQKAAMSLQKNFPKERKYYFWAIFLSYLLASDDRSSDMDRKLFGTLAYRMMSKAAADVPADPAELLSSPRAIQTLEELYLFMKMLESQDRSDEVVKILGSKNLGIGSRIVQNDSSFLSLKAVNLGRSKQWEEGVSFVKDTLTIPEDEEKRKAVLELDSWDIWNLLVEATRHLTNPGLTTEVLRIPESFISFHPKSRNAALARLSLLQCGIDKGEMSTEDLLVACREYLDHHKHKLYAFADIRGILGSDRDSMAKMIDYLSNDQNCVVANLNALKLDYCLNISGYDGTPPKQKTDEFVARCIKLYGTTSASDGVQNHPDRGDNSNIESKPSDDLCILAAMGLLQTNGSSETGLHPSDTSLIRAAAILGRLLDDSPHNYQALLLLVRIYVLLGVGSLAMDAFSRLSVKQMQYESVAHNLFTRLATIHPHPASPATDAAETKDFDPQSALAAALTFFRLSDVNTQRFRARGLENGTYQTVADLVELRRRLMNSVCRRMYALDVRRAQRLVGGDSMARYDDLAREDSPTMDTRHYNVFMDCEFVGKPEFELRMRQGPLPRDNWLASARITDQLFTVLKGIAIQRPLTSETDLPDLTALSLSESESDQTEVEKETTAIHKELLKVATFMAGSKLTSSEQADAAVGQVEKWLDEKKKELTLDGDKNSPLITTSSVFLQPGNPIAPTWRFLHATFMHLETLKASSQLVGLASRKASKTVKLPKERVERVSALVVEVFEMLRSNARSMKRRLSESGILTSLIDLVTQGEPSAPYEKELQSVLESTLDMSSVELFCGSLMESWEEALDGVLSVKL